MARTVKRAQLEPSGFAEVWQSCIAVDAAGPPIGVVYRPETEFANHYFEAVLAEQFDAYVWFEETTAVTPLPAEQPNGASETYPFGV